MYAPSFEDEKVVNNYNLNKVSSPPFSIRDFHNHGSPMIYIGENESHYFFTITAALSTSSHKHIDENKLNRRVSGFNFGSGHYVKVSKSPKRPEFICPEDLREFEIISSERDIDYHIHRSIPHAIISAINSGVSLPKISKKGFIVYYDQHELFRISKDLMYVQLLSNDSHLMKVYFSIFREVFEPYFPNIGSTAYVATTLEYQGNRSEVLMVKDGLFLYSGVLESLDDVISKGWSWVKGFYVFQGIHYITDINTIEGCNRNVAVVQFPRKPESVQLGKMSEHDIFGMSYSLFDVIEFIKRKNNKK